MARIYRGANFIMVGFLAAGLLAVGGVGAAQARDQISIVGSSTVFPFSTSVAEQFGRTSNFKTPVVESTGSGGGLKLFCAGIGLQHPDITNASRRIKITEYEKCQANGIDMTEIIIGFDGIVVANSKRTKSLRLTLKQIYLATAAKVPAADCTAEKCDMVANPYKNWRDISKSLPDARIEILGPPPTSGTRDAFQELAMGGGAKAYPYLNALKKKDKKAWQRLVYTMREDGAWIDAGENDNLMVNKLVANANAVGVFGYSFLDQNSDKIKGAVVNNIAPSFENIADGKYKISRSLYFYIKHAHIGTVPGIKEYVREFTSPQAIGEDGYLLDKGLIPLPEAERAQMRENGAQMKKLELSFE